MEFIYLSNGPLTIQDPQHAHSLKELFKKQMESLLANDKMITPPSDNLSQNGNYSLMHFDAIDIAQQLTLLTCH